MIPKAIFSWEYVYNLIVAISLEPKEMRHFQYEEMEAIAYMLEILVQTQPAENSVAYAECKYWLRKAQAILENA